MKKRNFYLQCCMVTFILSYFVVIGQTAVLSSCLGDHDGDGQVSYYEVESAINQFLGIDDVQNSYDEYGDGIVNVTDLQNTINRHLNGCGSADRYEDDDTLENSKILLEFLDEGNLLVKNPAYEPFQAHNFHSVDDVDWIKLYAYHDETQDYLIDVYDVGADCNPAIELYDESQNLIVPKTNQNPKGMDESLRFHQSYRSTDGIYYVKIFHNKSTPYNEGTENYYKVKLTQTDAPAFPGGVYGKVTPAVNGVVKTDLFGQGLILSGGWYFIFRPAGAYFIWVEASGYTYSDYINIGSAQYLRHDIYLQPAN